MLDARLRRLAGGVLCSQLADWLSAATLVGWLYLSTGSTADVAGLLAFRLAPPLLGGGLAATLVDRLPKGRLLLVLELLRCAGFATALAGVSGGSTPLIFAAVAVTGSAAAMSSATTSALVPAFVPDALLPRANAVVGVAAETAAAAGALGAGALLAAGGARIGLLCAVASSALAAACYRGLRLVGRPRPARRRTRGGGRVLAGSRPIAAGIAAFVVATAATALAGATFPRFLGGELGLGAGAYGFGIGAVAVGTGLGQAAAGARPALARGLGAVAASLLGMAALFLVLSQAPTAVAALAVLAAIGAVEGVGDVAFRSLVQREAGAEAAGRAFGLAQTGIRASAIGAVSLAPVVNALVGPREAILAGALPLAAAAGLAAASAFATGRASAGVAAAA